METAKNLHLGSIAKLEIRDYSFLLEGEWFRKALRRIKAEAVREDGILPEKIGLEFLAVAATYALSGMEGVGPNSAARIHDYYARQLQSQFSVDEPTLKLMQEESLFALFEYRTSNADARARLAVVAALWAQGIETVHQLTKEMTDEAIEFIENQICAFSVANNLYYNIENSRMMDTYLYLRRQITVNQWES